jgi:hypothetical protein
MLSYGAFVADVSLTLNFIKLNLFIYLFGTGV